MKPMKRAVLKSGMLLGITASVAFAYPTLNMVGPSDLVGLYTLTNTAGTETESGYGGGFTATLNGNTAMMFCVDFGNDVSIPQGPISVNTTPLTSSDFSDTRFDDSATYNPSSAGFVPINSIAYTKATGTLSIADADYLNNASYIQRYQMAAYLVSNYTFLVNGQPVPPTSDVVYGDSTNVGIQSAIWTLLDPLGSNWQPPPTSQDGAVGTWLTNAATWLQSGTDTAFLSNWEIVSDASIAGTTDPTRVNTGIQEFLTYTPAAVPEPSFYGILGFALVGLVWRARRARAAAALTSR